MGLLDSLKGLRKDEIARIAVPGEAAAELPEGNVALRWEEARENSFQKRVAAPADLKVEISPAGGGPPLDVVRATGGTSGAGRGRIYNPFGHVVVPQAGTYRLRAETAEERVDPALILRA